MGVVLITDVVVASIVLTGAFVVVASVVVPCVVTIVVLASSVENMMIDTVVDQLFCELAAFKIFVFIL